MKHLIFLSLFFWFSTATVSAQQYKYHIVERGETVNSIAQKYNITKETIYKYNPDAKQGIAENSKLVVPISGTVKNTGEVGFVTHKVKRKETIWRLSQQYNVSEDDIKRYNKHLYSAELRRGEEIRIPVQVEESKTTEEKFVENENKNPMGLTIKEHVVLPKENRFAISQRYNITIEELNRLNPGVGVLQPGMVLKISNGNTEKIREVEGGLFKYYQVKPKETLFNLTNRLGISKDSLVNLNPALAEGLKAGMVLKVPNVELAETVADYTESSRIRLESRIMDYEPKDLVVMLPFGLDKITTTDTTSNAAERIKRDRVLQIALDFYSGVLMAVDSAQTLGLSTNVQVYDTKQNSYEVSTIVNNNDFSQVDAVIGPLLQATAEAAAGRLQNSGIPVISPLTKKETRNWENFVQTRPTDEMLQDAMISYISQSDAGKNIIIIADPNAGPLRQKLLSAFPNSRTVNPRQGSYVDPSDLRSALVEGVPNWVILETESIGVISNVTSQLNSQAGRYNITLATTNRNNSFESDNVSNDHLARLNFHFPSVDKEFEVDSSNGFIERYIQKYGTSPNTYAVRGFDVTYDVLLRMASSENLGTSMGEEGTTEYVENKFDYEKGPAGGFINKAIYIMAYDEGLKLKVVR